MPTAISAICCELISQPISASMVAAADFPNKSAGVNTLPIKVQRAFDGGGVATGVPSHL